MRMPRFPLFGTAYYPDGWPEAEWRRDLEAIKAAGLTAVRWGEFSWSWWEPRPGEFTFDATDRFVRMIGEVGLDLILCTPTATPPPWLIVRHPDLLLHDQFGRPHVGPRHYGCFNHPEFLRFAERLIVRLAERYKDVPHLVGWQIDNELNLGECNSGNFYDYNPATIAAYRRWLQARYGTLEALNEAWCTSFWSRGYGAWEDIDPPRPKHSVINQSHWLAWTRFRAWSQAGFCHWQRDLLREVCPGVSVGTNIPDVKPTLMIELGQDYWQQAEGLDWAGTDLYAFRKDPAWEKRFLTYEIDLMRSALTHDGARFFVMETQAGPHNVPWRMDFVGGHFGPDYLDRCAQIYAQGGAEGICWFLWRPWRTGTEVGMNGIVDVDGSPTARTAAIPAINDRARATMAKKDGRRRVLMHYSASSLAIAAHADPERTPDASIPGWHALLAESGCVVDVLDEPRLAERGQGVASSKRTTAWRRDDLLVLPYSTVLSAGEIAAIRALLAAGGTVIAGFATGFFDAEGRIQYQRPAGLHDLLGVRQTAFDHLAPAHAWRCGDLAITGNVALVSEMDCTVSLRDDAGHLLVSTGRQGRAIFVACDLGSLVWNRAPGVAKLEQAVRAAAGWSTPPG